MSRYYPCQSSLPLRDAGLIEFASDNFDTCKIIRDVIQKITLTEASDLNLQYNDQDQLLKLFSMLQSQLSAEAAQSTHCRIAYLDENEVTEDNGNDEDEGWAPLSSFFGELGGRSIPDYILHRSFTSHLQPIVQPNGNIMGYEFLTRPLPEQMPFRPAQLFEIARQIGQHSFLDRAARQLAIRMSASHLKNGVKRFINFLPSSLYCPNACLKGTFDLIKELGTDPQDYVFEVTESEPLNDPKLNKVFDVYRQEGIRLALDDVGAGFSTLDTVNRLQPEYVKMDRKWVSQCDHDDNKKRYIDELLDRVSRFHGVVLAEGVERQEEWNYLKKSGVSLFQGYLFGKATPVPTSIPIGVR
jgi:EAL domain-containing protein (putative c-di-GMP-specific phosphodiesterase class I)